LRIGSEADSSTVGFPEPQSNRARPQSKMIGLLPLNLAGKSRVLAFPDIDFFEF
jgi:hypothetical protein